MWCGFGFLIHKNSTELRLKSKTHASADSLKTERLGDHLSQACHDCERMSRHKCHALLCLVIKN